MKIRGLLLLLCLFTLMRGEVVAQAGVVTFTYDDASLTQYTNAFRIMQEYSLPGTLFVISGGVDAGTVGSEPFHMTWDNVREMSAAGWEIGAHTHSVPHPDLTTLDDKQLSSELSFSKRRITQELGTVPTVFASPFGEFDARVIAEIKDHYTFHVRAWGGNNGFNSLTAEDVYALGRTEVRSTDTASYICDAIARAGSERLWLILMMHQVVTHDPEEYQVSVQTFTDIIGCTRMLRDQGIIQVQTIEDTLNQN